MSHSHTPTAATKATIAELAQPRTVDTVHPIAARFVYSLRLIALHQRAKRDPIPELAIRLNSVNVGAKTLSLSQSISAFWPEAIHVSRFCCCKLTHDEMTIANMIEGAVARDREEFERAGEGLIRPNRMSRLWDNVLELVVAELSAA